MKKADEQRIIKWRQEDQAEVSDLKKRLQKSLENTCVDLGGHKFVSRTYTVMRCRLCGKREKKEQ